MVYYRLGQEERESEVNRLPAEGKHPVFGDLLLGLLEETRETLEGKGIFAENRRGMWARRGWEGPQTTAGSVEVVSGSCYTSAEVGKQEGSDHQRE